MIDTRRLPSLALRNGVELAPCTEGTGSPTWHSQCPDKAAVFCAVELVSTVPSIEPVMTVPSSEVTAMANANMSPTKNRMPAIGPSRLSDGALAARTAKAIAPPHARTNRSIMVRAAFVRLVKVSRMSWRRGNCQVVFPKRLGHLAAVASPVIRHTDGGAQPL